MEKYINLTSENEKLLWVINHYNLIKWKMNQETIFITNMTDSI
jgi:hypothetical protein